MKTAVVYYSMDENCTLIAQEIKLRLNADIIRLETVDSKKRSFLGKMLWGGSMVVFKKKPPLKPYNFNPDNYDLIILGAPVWADNVAPPMQTFLQDTKISGKHIALYMCLAGKMETAMEKFKTMLNENLIIGEIYFKSPLKDAREDIKRTIGDWTIELFR